ncbi:hypothetical protein [Caulobacter sp. BE254]|jgi:hypothetical protein|uniref:hypothetical protein n=1 Tax=Caulobacter sp. BE254 TaxID=2817720 RepID=UPI00285D111F|nr:hypothetical protein [Caulobacter sp. BE254]MDR7118134.1 hypothetical protein [Caulobacter sp. BE254]
MAAYDASYGTPAAARQGLLATLSDKVSGLFNKAPADPYAPTPPADYALRPDAQGKVTLAGYKVPVAIAVLGAGVIAALLINRRTRAPAIAAATTAWSFFGSKLAK